MCLHFRNKAKRLAGKTKVKNPRCSFCALFFQFHAQWLCVIQSSVLATIWLLALHESIFTSSIFLPSSLHRNSSMCFLLWSLTGGVIFSICIHYSCGKLLSWIVLGGNSRSFYDASELLFQIQDERVSEVNFCKELWLILKQLQNMKNSQYLKLCLGLVMSILISLFCFIYITTFSEVASSSA